MSQGLSVWGVGSAPYFTCSRLADKLRLGHPPDQPHLADIKRSVVLKGGHLRLLKAIFVP